MITNVSLDKNRYFMTIINDLIQKVEALQSDSELYVKKKEEKS